MTRTLMSTIMLMGLSATAVKAENSDSTLSWDIYSTPDVLTKEVTRQVGSQVTFSDGVTLQVFARCRETGIGTKPIYYPGLALVFGA
jgi:hypothetical protein